MTDYEVRVGGDRVEPRDDVRFDWIDRATGLGRLTFEGRSVSILVEGGGSDWTVTLRGRRIDATVRSWRERLFAEAEGAARAHAGAVTMKATLPGLVVGIRVAPGDDVADGQSLLTIEAMKMQNEVRAPRAGRIGSVAVEAGRVVATGEVLLTLE
jgi:acetyl/propionyl-CoA carboxylase alpha subunit